MKILNIITILFSFLNAINSEKIENFSEDKHLSKASNRRQTCGQTKYISGERIIGGRPAHNGEFPWQVAVYSFVGDSINFCGGVIIDRRTILIAAHCVQSKNTVSVIRYDSLFLDRGGMLVNDYKIVINPKYNNKTGENDIAIIKTLKPMILGLENSGAICLPHINIDPKPGIALTVSGWGETKYNGNQPTVLRSAMVRVYDRNVCRQPYSQLGAKVTDKMICAGSYRTGVCSGDSGGPLVDYINGRAILIGIVSESFYCGLDNVPDVYTRVSAYLDWINSYIE